MNKIDKLLISLSLLFLVIWTTLLGFYLGMKYQKNNNYSYEIKEITEEEYNEIINKNEKIINKHD